MKAQRTISQASHGFVLDAQRERGEAFPNVEFDDAAWNMTLDFYDKHAAGRHATIMSLCTVSGVPQTSALRSINLMVERGHFIRRRDPADGYRIFIHPVDRLVDAVEHYLSKFGCCIDALVNPVQASNDANPSDAKTERD